ncbi:MAG: hypothetical protein ACTH2Q_01500 [Propionibacteriaceae bacterium]
MRDAVSRALKTKQWVPLSDVEREALRTEAAARDVTVGLLARALLLYTLDRIDTVGVGRRIEEEKAETRRRISDGARAAALTRWGSTERSTK